MPSDVFRNTFCRDPSPWSLALWLFFAFRKLIPALACRLWSHHHSSSPGFACPSSHTERAWKKGQHLSRGCNSGWRPLWGRRQSESCWRYPPAQDPPREGCRSIILPLLHLQPSVPITASLRMGTPLPWGSWCCATGQEQGMALLCCSELQHPGGAVCRAALGRWMGRAAVCQHLLWGSSELLGSLRAIGRGARFWQGCCCSGHNLSASHLFSFAPASSSHDNSVAAHPSKASSRINKLDYQIFQQQVSAKEEKPLSPYNKARQGTASFIPAKFWPLNIVATSGRSQDIWDCLERRKWSRVSNGKQ